MSWERNTGAGPLGRSVGGAAARPRIYIVGAGPGDPELLTLKAVRLLEAADAVVYDRLVSPEILDLVPPGAMRIYVGKATDSHTLCQDEINELLARLARAGRTVVRLKGGDPNVFGRAGEEAEYLGERGIACEIVPGVTAASGCAAAAGLPLTYRGLATGVRFVTGHCRAEVPLDLDWQSLADPKTTLVIYMGLENLPVFSRELIRAGLAPTTPAAAIMWGTTARQRMCVATLAELPGKVRAEGFEAPVLTIVGRVVSRIGLFDSVALREPSRSLAQEA